MEWLNPAGAWALLGALPVIALYVLKRRARRVPVPSLALWKRAQEPAHRSRPFQRLKNQLLLWLQLLMVALFAVALMRPVTAGGLQSECVLVFDLSASMQARGSDGQSRLDAAKQSALKRLNGMRDGAPVTVLAAGSSFAPLLSRSADHAQAERVIRGLEAQNGGADLSGALALAAAMQRELPAIGVYVYSDSDVDLPGGAALEAAGEGAPNVSLMDMTLQPERGTAFVRVVSWGEDREVRIECYAGDALCDVRTVSLTSNESQGVTLNVPAGTPQVTARVTPGGALAVDDARYAVQHGERRYTALLVTEGNVFLEQALKLMPGLELVLASPQDAGAASGCDLYIYDGMLPAGLPQTGAVWAVNPPQPLGGIEPGEITEAAVSPRAAAGDTAAALCENLLLTGLSVREWHPLTGGTPVIASGGQTLLSVAENGRQRIAVLGFDLHESNLPLQADFPILVQNLLAWLLPEAAAQVEGAVCGDRVTFSLDARTASAYVETPSGRKAALDADGFADTDEPGVYRLVELFEDGRERETPFALHAPQAEYDTRTVAASRGGAQEQAAGRREWTPWVLAALFLVMLLEWGVSRRGV